MNFDKPGIVEDNYREVISSIEDIIAVSYTHLTLPTILLV